MAIKFRCQDAAQWAMQNPMLAMGEPGHETDLHGFKIGNGMLAWNDLPYQATMGGGGGGMGGGGNLDGGTPTSTYGGIDPVDGGGV